jgi:hypothetical protein
MIEGQMTLLSFLQQEAGRAKQTTLNDERAVALAYYNGEPYGDEVEGRSQLRTRDVAEVIDQQVISVLRTMVSGDNVVEFDGESDEAGEDGQPVDFGQQATEAVQYQFMRKQRGYRVLHDSLKAGLLEKIGIVKSWAAREYDVSESELPVEGLLAAQEMPEVEILAAEPVDETEVEWRVRTRVAKPIQFKDMAVPNEEFLISPDARDLETAPYVAHVSETTLCELIAMGFDAEQVSALWGDQPQNTTLSNARDASQVGSEVSRSGSQRKVWLYEEYTRFDANGDGYDELIQVFRVGAVILSVEEVEENPFSGWSPFPMQHRFVGQSSADKCMDIQLTRSTMLRQAMDNLYLSNAPRMGVDMSTATDDTISDLLTVRPGGLIRYKGGMPPTPVQIPFVAGDAFTAMEVMTGEREARTGVTRHNQGLNPDTLNKTASGMAMLQDAGDQVQEYIARNFAENLVAPMFAKRYRLMRKFGQPFTMKIDGQRVTIDPTKWPEDIDMRINVGLGTGRKDQRIAYRSQLLQVQMEGRQANSPLVNDEKIFNNLKGLIKDAALGTPSDYFVDPGSEEGQAAQQQQADRQDPAMAEAQAKAMLEAEKLQAQQQEAMQQSQLKQQQAAYDHEAKMRQVDANITLDRERAEAEAELAVRKQNFEFEMARERAAFERRMKSAQNDDDSGVQSYRAGGDLSQ